MDPLFRQNEIKKEEVKIERSLRQNYRKAEKR
jgi:hypothetical protein